MRVLVACEFSGVVRRAFRDRGHRAWSCDLLPAEDGSEFHHQMDVRLLLAWEWDLLISHPPCTHLAVSGARWLTDHWVASKKRPGGRYWHDGATKRAEQAAALDFARALLDAPIPKIALENPVSVLSTKLRKPDQIIEPRQYGHGETKKTCLWLKGLPKPVPTDIVEGREARVHKMPPGPNRWKGRSRTFQGIADAMAAQWGAE